MTYHGPFVTFSLLWGRTKDQHTLQSRTGAVGKKRKQEPSPSHWHPRVSCARRGLSGGAAVKRAWKVEHMWAVSNLHQTRITADRGWNEATQAIGDWHWGYYHFLLLLPVRFRLGFIYLITAGTGLDSCCFGHCACLYELLSPSIIWAGCLGDVCWAVVGGRSCGAVRGEPGQPGLWSCISTPSM